MKKSILFLLALTSVSRAQLSNVSWTTPNPAGGREARATYTTTGAAVLDSVQIAINFASLGAGGCDIYYSRSAQRFSVWSDATSSWIGSQPVGGADIEGEQCIFRTSTASVSTNGTTIGVTATIFFKNNFRGTNQVYISNSETQGFSSSLGDMTAFPPTNNPPVGVDATQTAAGGTGGRFTFHASDDNGFGYISQMMLQVGTPSVSGCMFMYYPIQNVISIMNDAGTNWVQYATLGNGTGLGAEVANSQCAVDVAGATKAGSGNDLRVTLPIQFRQPGYAGVQNLRILSLFDRANLRQDYFTQSFGTFTVGGTASLSAASASFGFAGDTKTVDVAAGSGVGWVAVPRGVNPGDPYPTWVHALSGGSGVGNGVLQYSVDANAGAARTGAIAVGGAVLTITQDGAAGATVSSMLGPTWTVPVPVAGTPREAQFRFTTKGTSGPVDTMQVIVNWGIAQQGGCVIYFSKTNNGMQLWSDAVGN